jgi:DNA-binding response OmpR family regulator
VLTRQEIPASVWGLEFDPGTNVVEVYGRYLRRKIERPNDLSLITTVQETGSTFESLSAA